MSVCGNDMDAHVWLYIQHAHVCVRVYVRVFAMCLEVCGFVYTCHYIRPYPICEYVFVQVPVKVPRRDMCLL